MTTPPTFLKEGAIRSVKIMRLMEFMSSTLDLLNSEVDDSAWLEKFAALANCRAAACFWWSAGRPETLRESRFGPDLNLPEDSTQRMEDIIAATEPDEPVALDELGLRNGKLNDSNADDLFTPERLAFCLNAQPARVCVVFGARIGEPAWQQYDRDNFGVTLPLISKSIDTKMCMSWKDNVIDLMNNVFDEIPRGFVSMQPNGTIISVNHLAQRLIESGELLVRDGNRLALPNPAMQAEFETQLNRIRGLDDTDLKDFAWHKNLSGKVDSDSCMVALLAFKLKDWRLESTPFDRVAVMVIQYQALMALPTEEQLGEFYQLTRAQARLLHTLMQGASVEESAEILNVSVNTVRSHLRAIYATMGVESKGELLRLAAATITGYVKEDDDKDD